MGMGGESGLRETLLKKFCGLGAIPIEEVLRFVLEETPYSEAMHLKQKTLGKMERESPSSIQVERPAGSQKRAGTYPDGTFIQFLGS